MKLDDEGGKRKVQELSLHQEYNQGREILKEIAISTQKMLVKLFS